MRYFLTFLLLFSAALMAQDKPAYQLFDSQGKKLSYAAALKRVQSADMVFFGELHNNAIAHWMQLLLLEDFIRLRGAVQLQVGAEMLETDQQAEIERYRAGSSDEKTFVKEAGRWPNFKTDYLPVFRLCQAENIPIFGCNVPRKYARMVAMQGGLAALDSLPDAEKALFAPQPIEVPYDLPSYAAMRDMMGGHGQGMNMDHFIAAQAIKDATMAHVILRHWQPGKLFYHLNGSYHSDSKEGIVWYVKKQRPELRIANLSTVSQADLSRLEEQYKGKADVILVVDERMTNTH